MPPAAMLEALFSAVGVCLLVQGGERWVRAATCGARIALTLLRGWCPDIARAAAEQGHLQGRHFGPRRDRRAIRPRIGRGGPDAHAPRAHRLGSALFFSPSPGRPLARVRNAEACAMASPRAPPAGLQRLGCAVCARGLLCHKQARNAASCLSQPPRSAAPVLCLPHCDPCSNSILSLCRIRAACLSVSALAVQPAQKVSALWSRISVQGRGGTDNGTRDQLFNISPREHHTPPARDFGQSLLTSATGRAAWHGEARAA